MSNGFAISIAVTSIRRKLDQLGLAPAQTVLTAIDSVRTLDDVARLMGSVQMGTKALFRSGIGIDDKNPDSYAVFVGQGGLGLPDRDYYLLNDKAITAARDGYRAYIAKIFDLAQIPGGAEKMEGIFKLETEIAKLQWARAERRNADKVYNPMTVAELERSAPVFPGAVSSLNKAFPARRTAPDVSLWARTPLFPLWPPFSRIRRCKPGAII